MESTSLKEADRNKDWSLKVRPNVESKLLVDLLIFNGRGHFDSEITVNKKELKQALK